MHTIQPIKKPKKLMVRQNLLRLDFSQIKPNSAVKLFGPFILSMKKIFLLEQASVSEHMCGFVREGGVQ